MRKEGKEEPPGGRWFRRALNNIGKMVEVINGLFSWARDAIPRKTLLDGRISIAFIYFGSFFPLGNERSVDWRLWSGRSNYRTGEKHVGGNPLKVLEIRLCPLKNIIIIGKWARMLMKDSNYPKINLDNQYIKQNHKAQGGVCCI
jgi:hypothetical protein